MSVAVTFLLTTAMSMLVVLSFGRDLLATFAQLTGSWAAVEGRWEQETDTKITAPPGQWVAAGPTVRLTLVNNGRVALAQFADWDAIFVIQQASGLGIDYLTYTTTTPPGSNQWTVDAIYLNTATSTPETVGPGILDPGEKMVVLAKPATPVVAGTWDRGTFSTPNGVTARIIFEIK